MCVQTCLPACRYGCAMYTSQIYLGTLCTCLLNGPSSYKSFIIDLKCVILVYACIIVYIMYLCIYNYIHTFGLDCTCASADMRDNTDI